MITIRLGCLHKKPVPTAQHVPLSTCRKYSQNSHQFRCGFGRLGMEAWMLWFVIGKIFGAMD